MIFNVTYDKSQKTFYFFKNSFISLTPVAKRSYLDDEADNAFKILMEEVLINDSLDIYFGESYLLFAKKGIKIL